ncbi:MAG: 30S ribosomal protein S3 [Candidatus Aenigmatarchaeota archaeon]
MWYKKIVAQAVTDKLISDILKQYFEKQEFSKAKIERSPTITRIIIYVGRKNSALSKLRKIEDELKEKLMKEFNLLNPTFVIEEVENPYLDAKIVAYRIRKAIERGVNFKKAAMFYIERAVENGAAGIEVRISGKLLGKERSAAYKFRKGYILHSGYYKEKYVDVGYDEALIKVGKIGIQVRILKQVPEEYVFEKW